MRDEASCHNMQIVRGRTRDSKSRLGPWYLASASVLTPRVGSILKVLGWRGMEDCTAHEGQAQLWHRGDVSPHDVRETGEGLGKQVEKIPLKQWGHHLCSIMHLWHFTASSMCSLLGVSCFTRTLEQCFGQNPLP